MHNYAKQIVVTKLQLLERSINTAHKNPKI